MAVDHRTTASSERSVVPASEGGSSSHRTRPDHLLLPQASVQRSVEQSPCDCASVCLEQQRSTLELQEVGCLDSIRSDVAVAGSSVAAVATARKEEAAEQHEAVQPQPLQQPRTSRLIGRSLYPSLCLTWSYPDRQRMAVAPLAWIAKHRSKALQRAKSRRE